MILLEASKMPISSFFHQNEGHINPQFSIVANSLQDLPRTHLNLDYQDILTAETSLQPVRTRFKPSPNAANVFDLPENSFNPPNSGSKYIPGLSTSLGSGHLRTGSIPIPGTTRLSLSQTSEDSAPYPSVIIPNTINDFLATHQVHY